MDAYLEYLKEHNPEMAKYFELMRPMMEKKSLKRKKKSQKLI
ncbi:hypothetical protein ACQ9BO_15720 [Flavobacterium sp. P21]